MSERALRVLVVDDETPIRRFLRASLTSHGHEVFETGNGTDALKAVPLNKPDVVILDLGLPDMDGLEVVKQLREWTRVPIIILSVRDHDLDKVAALDAGADDYVTKPFSVQELMARIRAALRHIGQLAAEPIFQSGDLTVDITRRTVKLGQNEIVLTPIEFDLLKTLVLNAGKVLTHRHLLQEVWGSEYEDESHLLRVHISNIRSKIEAEPARPSHIVTEPGVGYRLKID